MTILQINLGIFLLEGGWKIVLTNNLPETYLALVTIQLVADLTTLHLSFGYLEGTLCHVVDVVLTVAVAHNLALTAYIELFRHSFLAYIVRIADGAADGMRTIAADDVRSQFVSSINFEGSHFDFTNHQTVLDDTSGVVIPTHKAADTVVSLNLTSIDTVEQLGVRATNVTEDTARTDVGVAGTGHVHVRDTVLDAQTLTCIAYDTAVVLTGTVDLTIYNQVLDGTAAVLEQAETIAALALDGDLMSLAVKRTFVGVVVAVTNGHVVTREINVGSKISIDGCLTVVDAVGKCLELLSRADVKEAILVLVAVFAVHKEDWTLRIERYRELVRTDVLGKGITLTSFLVHLVADLTVLYLIPSYLEGTLCHVVDVVLTIAVAHYLALTAYIELFRHSFLAYIVRIADGAADGMRTIAADDVRSQFVSSINFEGSHFDFTNHQTVLDDTSGVVIPTHKAADTVVSLNLTSIDTVEQLGVRATNVTEDTARTDVGVAGTGHVHVGDTVLDTKTLACIAYDTAVVLAGTVDFAVNNQVLDGTAAVLEEAHTVTALASDGDSMALAIKSTLVGVVVAVTNRHVVTREVDIGSQLGINFCLTVVNHVGKGLELCGCANADVTVFVHVAVDATHLRNGAMGIKG